MCCAAGVSRRQNCVGWQCRGSWARPARFPPAQIDPITISRRVPAPNGLHATNFRASGWKNRWRWVKYFAVTLLAALGAAIFLYATAPGEPAACEISVNTLIVKDGQGREIWRREFPEGLNRDRYAVEPPFCEYADLDGDGAADVLFSLKRQSYLLHGDTLYGFITRSRMLRRLLRGR